MSYQSEDLCDRNRWLLSKWGPLLVFIKHTTWPFPSCFPRVPAGTRTHHAITHLRLLLSQQSIPTVHWPWVSCCASVPTLSTAAVCGRGLERGGKLMLVKRNQIWSGVQSRSGILYNSRVDFFVFILGTASVSTWIENSRVFMQMLYRSKALPFFDILFMENVLILNTIKSQINHLIS